MPWQLQALEALASKPSADISEVEQVSMEISLFLTQAPTDFLEPLLSSPLEGSTNFLERCCKERFQRSRREPLQFLESTAATSGVRHARGWAVLLAYFLFSA